MDRVMIRVQSNSVILRTVQKPVMAAPTFTDDKMLVSSTAIQVDAMAVLEEAGEPPNGPQGRGARGAPAMPGGSGGYRTAAVQGVAPAPTAAAARGWRLGWIQLQTSEVNWAYYEGRELGSGSTLMCYDREPVRTPAICRDGSFEGGIWYRAAKSGEDDVSVFDVTGTERLPLEMSAIHGDMPSNEFLLEHENTITKVTNHLRVCELKLHFCTVLTLKKQDAHYNVIYTFLKHFEWSVGGRYVVTAPRTAQESWRARLEGRDLCQVSAFRDGQPKGEYVKDLTAPMSLHCNTEAALATSRVKPQESRARTGPPQ
jgi:hypothetical protein